MLFATMTKTADDDANNITNFVDLVGRQCQCISELGRQSNAAIFFFVSVWDNRMSVASQFHIIGSFDMSLPKFRIGTTIIVSSENS